VYPAALQDMISAYLYLIDPPSNKTQKKILPSQIIFMGDSAGGNLALCTLLWLREQSKWPLPGGLVLLSPWMDASHFCPSFTLNAAFDYLPSESRDPQYIHEARNHYFIPHNSLVKHRLVSPLFSDIQLLQNTKKKEEKNLHTKDWPATLIQLGDAEKLRDESLVFYSKFKDLPLQVELYQDMIHVFQLVSIFSLIFFFNDKKKSLSISTCLYLMFFSWQQYLLFLDLH
jgi:acetyl esterase/lipase